MSQDFVIYTDESDKKGQLYASFYGGALVRSADLKEVSAELHRVAAEVGLTAEIKWQKVSSGFLDRYERLIDRFFDMVREDRVKVRIMFTQTRHVRSGLTPYQREHTYHLLYYQFLKHAFGLRHCNPEGHPIRLRIYLDNLPDTREKNALFRLHVARLEHSRQVPGSMHPGTRGSDRRGPVARPYRFAVSRCGAWCHAVPSQRQA